MNFIYSRHLSQMKSKNMQSAQTLLQTLLYRFLLRRSFFPFRLPSSVFFSSQLSERCNIHANNTSASRFKREFTFSNVPLSFLRKREMKQSRILRYCDILSTINIRSLAPHDNITVDITSAWTRCTLILCFLFLLCLLLRDYFQVPPLHSPL